MDETEKKSLDQENLPDPTSLYFCNNWKLYANLQCGSTTYSLSYIEISDISTIADYWMTMNNIPSAFDLHTNQVFIDNKRVSAYSLFKEDITPEWEHPINENGCEWGCRENLTDSTFAHMWQTLTLMAVNNELDYVIGIRCINKTNRMRNLHKIEVWLDNDDYNIALSVKDLLDKTFENCPLFTLMYHKDKKQQAYEYLSKRIKHKKRT